MIFCNFCGGKGEINYLYLTCGHLCCLCCAFLRTDFSFQQIECCNKYTKIEQASMQMIIKSKGYLKVLGQKNQNQDKCQKVQDNFNQKQQKVSHFNKQQYKENNRESQQIDSIENKNFTKEQEQQKQNQKEGYDANKKQQSSSQLQEILTDQVSKIKKYFQEQRKQLKQKQQATMRDLIKIYQQEIKTCEKPAKLDNSMIQRICNNIQNRVLPSCSRTDRNQNTSPKLKIVASSRDCKADLKQSKESYDHILKRLEINQERMREKIQKHMHTLY